MNMNRYKRRVIFLASYSIAILALAIVINSVNLLAGDLRAEWGSRYKHVKAGGVNNNSLTAQSDPLPIIINDPLGDHFSAPGPGFGIVDIGIVKGGSNGGAVTIIINFSPNTDMFQLAGYIDLDTDQDQFTGESSPDHDIGTEYFLDLFLLPLGIVFVVDPETGLGVPVGDVLVNIVEPSIEMTIPLAMLGNDEGNMDIGMLLGTFLEPTDIAPNSGHGTINVVGPTLVTLVSFTATEFNEKVRLKWETATEIDNAGFNIWRSEGDSNTFVKINELFIIAQGDETIGEKYFFTDLDVVPGKTYHYQLEDVEFDGDSTLHGPISVTIDSNSRRLGDRDK